MNQSKFNKILRDIPEYFPLFTVDEKLAFHTGMYYETRERVIVEPGDKLICINHNGIATFVTVKVYPPGKNASAGRVVVPDPWVNIKKLKFVGYITKGELEKLSHPDVTEEL